MIVLNSHNAKAVVGLKLYNQLPMRIEEEGTGEVQHNQFLLHSWVAKDQFGIKEYTYSFSHAKSF